MKVTAVSLQGRLGKLGVDAILFNTSENLLSVNLRYISGFTGSDAAALITRAGRHLFTDSRYKFQATEQARDFQVHVVRRKIDALSRALKKAKVRKLGIEPSRVSHEFVQALGKRVPEMKMVGLGRTFLEGLRIRKSTEEKDNIRKAAEIASRSCRQLLDNGALTGRTEVAVAQRLEMLFRKNGAQAAAFETIVASGPRSALPHGVASSKVIGKGELVIIDFGCRYEGYNSDETVTCIVGKPSADQKRIHKAVYEAHMRAIDALKAGIRARQVDRIARESINRAGFRKHFLHGLGHGLGLEVHEPPYLSPIGRGIISEGMVFTIEPGIYIEGVGGVRLESLVYLNRDGPEILSKMPKDLIEIT